MKMKMFDFVNVCLKHNIESVWLVSELHTKQFLLLKCGEKNKLHTNNYSSISKTHA